MTTASGSADLHLSTGAMALHALPGDEESQFLDHLDDCESCAPELAGFTETLGRLAVLTEQAPPASLRTSVLAAVAVTPQLPPMVADAGRHRVAEADEPVAAPAPQVPAGGGDADGDSDGGTVIPLRRHWYQRPATLIAAAVIAIALVVSGIVIANRPGSGTENLATMESCVATAADAQVLTPTVGAGGNVRYAPSCGAATVTLPEVPDAPQGMGYQMWVMTGPTAAPVGMVTTGATGTPDPMTFEVQDPATDIGVSVEPAAGSTTPTTDPIWVVHLPA